MDYIWSRAYIMNPSQQLMTSLGVKLPITFKASSFKQNTTASSTLVIDKPTGTIDGDIMIAFMGNNLGDTGAWSTPAGWTEVYDRGDGDMMLVAYKVASGEGANYTFNASVSSNGYGGQILTFANALFDVGGAATTSTSPLVAPSITVATANSVLLAMYIRQANGITFTTPSGMTSLISGTIGGVGPSWHIFSQEVDAGATGTRSSTQSAGTLHSSGLLLALKTL